MGVVSPTAVAAARLSSLLVVLDVTDLVLLCCCVRWKRLPTACPRLLLTCTVLGVCRRW